MAATVNSAQNSAVRLADQRPSRDAVVIGNTADVM
jgi:hypothetical protein